MRDPSGSLFCASIFKINTLKLSTFRCGKQLIFGLDINHIFVGQQFH